MSYGNHHFQAITGNIPPHHEPVLWKLSAGLDEFAESVEPT